MHFQSLWLFLDLFLPWPEEKKVLLLWESNLYGTIIKHFQASESKHEKKKKISDDYVCYNRNWFFLIPSSQLHSQISLVYLSLLTLAVSILLQNPKTTKRKKQNKKKTTARKQAAVVYEICPMQCICSSFIRRVWHFDLKKKNCTEMLGGCFCFAL